MIQVFVIGRKIVKMKFYFTEYEEHDDKSHIIFKEKIRRFQVKHVLGQQAFDEDLK